MTDQLIDELKKNNLKGLYYIYGNEGYLADYYLSRIQEAVIPEKIDGINYETYHFRDAGLQTILAAANTMSFMGDKKMIVVRESDLLSKEKALSPSAISAFADYVAEPNPMTVLVFMGEQEIKGLGRNKLAAMIKKSSQAALVPAEKAKGAALKKYVRDHLSRKGLRASDEVVDRLVLIAEKGLYLLENELEKILIINESGLISLEEADQLISYTPDGRIFELVDAVIAKKTARAVQLLDEYLAAGEPEYMLRAMLISSFRRLLIIKDALAAGYMKPVFRKYLDTSSDFLIDKSVRQVKQISMEELESVYRRLYLLEYVSRSSRQDSKKLLKDCIIEIS